MIYIKPEELENLARKYECLNRTLVKCLYTSLHIVRRLFNIMHTTRLTDVEAGKLFITYVARITGLKTAELRPIYLVKDCIFLWLMYNVLSAV